MVCPCLSCHFSVSMHCLAFFRDYFLLFVFVRCVCVCVLHARLHMLFTFLWIFRVKLIIAIEPMGKNANAFVFLSFFSRVYKSVLLSSSEYDKISKTCTRNTSKEQEKNKIKETKQKKKHRRMHARACVQRIIVQKRKS